MIKEIKYNGFTTSPSDYECPDGDLAGSLGLICEDGALHPVQQPSELFPTNGLTVRLLHKVRPEYNYILIGSNGMVYWVAKDKAENTGPEELEDFSGKTIHQFNVIGNTLLILASDGMHYYLWKANKYITLGTHLPEMPIRFSTKLWNTYGGEKQVVTHNDRALDDETLVAEFWQALMATVNSAVATCFRNFGFCFPFFVRYAYRLYDGSLTMHSAPILIIPRREMQAVTIEGLDKTNPNRISYSADTLELSTTIQAFHLTYQADNSALESLTQWSDIVSSVDVFISTPTYLYEQSAEASPKNVGFITGPVAADWESHILEQSNFYLAKSIPLNQVNTGEPHIEVDRQKGAVLHGYIDLDFSSAPSSIANRERLLDDFDSHDSLLPEYSYVYNARLNITAISKSLFSGFRPDTFFYEHMSDNQLTSAAAQVTVELQTDSGTFYVRSEIVDIPVKIATPSSPGITVPLWFYYPSSAAKRAWFSIDEKTYRMELQPHPFLLGAYCSNIGNNNVEVVVEPIPEPSEDTTIQVPSKVYTSEVNNPFFFPLLGINTVGSGSIIALSSAAKAMSQGQFGQFPLYAFTSEGVWALEVSKTGAFSSVNPVTRDVCLSPDSICQLDSTVLFASQRGIMQLSGSTSQCISDNIDSQQELSLALTGLENVVPVMKTFREFITGGRMIYDYANQRVILYNPDYDYDYVYSLKSNLWGLTPSNIIGSVPSYPDALAMTRTGDNLALVNVSAPATDSQSPHDDSQSPHDDNILLITRPLKLDAPNLMKTVDTVIQRGFFRHGHIKSILYGSRDLFHWFPVWSSHDHYLRGFRGTPYKYFRIVVRGYLAPDESIFGCTVRFTPRLNNRPR